MERKHYGGADMSTEKIKKAVIREDLLSITNDFRKAIILNQFIYWSERVSDADKFIERRKNWLMKLCLVYQLVRLDAI